MRGAAATEAGSSELSTIAEFVEEQNREQLKNKMNELNNAQNNLGNVIQQRNNFISSLPGEWEKERHKQFDELLPSLNDALKKLDLPELTEREKDKLGSLHKAQELMLMKDSPVPKKRLPSQQRRKKKVPLKI